MGAPPHMLVSVLLVAIAVALPILPEGSLNPAQTTSPLPLQICIHTLNTIIVWFVVYDLVAEGSEEAGSSTIFCTASSGSDVSGNYSSVDSSPDELSEADLAGSEKCQPAVVDEVRVMIPGLSQ